MQVSPKSFSRDINGNSIVRFSILCNKQNSDVSLNGRKIDTSKPSYSYSLQTAGNLPKTHNLKLSGQKLNELSAIDINNIANEIADFLRKYGSDKQKFLISIHQ